MARETDRRRHTDPLQRRRHGEEVYPVRVKLPESMLASAATAEAAECIKKGNLINWVLGHLRDGGVEEIFRYDDERDCFRVDAKIDGTWYHLIVTFSPTGDDCG